MTAGLKTPARSTGRAGRAEHAERAERAERAGRSRRAGRRRLRLLVAVLVLSGLVAGALGVLHSPLFSARHVVIVGATHTSRAEVLAASGLLGDPPLVDVDPVADERALEHLSWVRGARVERQWFSSVKVVLTERVAVAYARRKPSGFLVFDDTGRALEVARSKPSGLVAVAPGGRLPRPSRWLSPRARALCLVAGSLPVALAAKVSEITLSKSDGPVVRLDDGDQAILGSIADLRAKMVALSTVLAKVSLAENELIDLRIPSSPVLTP